MRLPSAAFGEPKEKTNALTCSMSMMLTAAARGPVPRRAHLWADIVWSSMTNERMGMREVGEWCLTATESEAVGREDVPILCTQYICGHDWLLDACLTIGAGEFRRR